ncbi:MAG: sensor histidine kinase [Anaerolineae bacterium]
MKKSLPLRNRLFLNYLVMLLLGMGIATLLAWRAVEGLYVETQRENLLAQARLVAAALQGQPLPAGTEQPYSQTLNTLPGIHTRLLGEQGGVVYSLPLPSADVAAPVADNRVPVSAQELSARPEIAAAMKGGSQTAIRSVAGRRILYAAAAVLGNDGKVTGIAYLAMPLPAGLPAGITLQLAGAVLVAIVLALIAGTLLARRIVSPVETIARAAGSVSAGDLAQQVPNEGDINELNALGRAFNQMTASLRQSEQAKNSFVADVTHELRTPLTVIKGTIETLEDGALDDVTGGGPLLESMQRETDRLIRLVNDLLVLTRADAGALNLDTRSFDLVELARSRCSHLGPLAALSQVRLEVTGIPTAPVLGDVDRSSQVLDNLLDNAIRYSPPISNVTITITRSGAEFHCAVRDCGPGIAPRHLPFIFDRFYRTEASRNRQSGGAGLGLAIAKALVLAQGGQIGAESKEGCGTTVWFSLPPDPDCPNPD